ncbi:MAG: Y-family DNA polymerase [Spirochaetaceae bacterium]|nr:Y-family DNA polymerase [Spirochaetaceae bacterium]
MILHIDGNSFYASCERVFRPDLAGKPVAVLTNNDGIIIALNQECKNLGFKRGDVFYQVRRRAEALGVIFFSSNYTLYADMSARLNTIYSRYAPELEFYSIDESFLFFPDWDGADYSAIAREIRNAAKLETGLPVSVGIAPTKTLAKLCNKLAKQYNGVCNWAQIDRDKTLAEFPVEGIWGIGRQKSKALQKKGVRTALDLKNYPLDRAKKDLTITGWRTVRELNGIRCLDRAEPDPRQSIIVSRSFSSAVYDKDTIAGALAEYAQEAVKRLRSENLAAKIVSVYVMTNPLSDGEQYFNSATVCLNPPSAILTEILSAAQNLLTQIYRDGYRYRKTLIALNGLCLPPEQGDLFINTERREKLERLSDCFEKINERWGRGTIRQGTAGLAAAKTSRPSSAAAFAPWETRREFLSPRYTTCLSEIPTAF